MSECRPIFILCFICPVNCYYQEHEDLLGSLKLRTILCYTIVYFNLWLWMTGIGLWHFPFIYYLLHYIANSSKFWYYYVFLSTCFTFYFIFSPKNISQPSLDWFVPNLAWTCVFLYVIYSESSALKKVKNQITTVKKTEK